MRGRSHIGRTIDPRLEGSVDGVTGHERGRARGAGRLSPRRDRAVAQRARARRVLGGGVRPARSALGIVVFWAEWCGPCKQLSPVLEKVAADYAARGVRLVKIDVDENKAIAAQFRVQSIPTVYAIFQGQLVADLTPARTEGQLTRFLDQILAQLPVEGEAQQLEAEIEPLIAMGEQVLADGDAERAVSIFQQILDMAPDNP